jgi:PKD repeat protein
MLALHRGRTALTLACLLATAALGGAATHASTADAAFGQIGSSLGSWGTGSGQFDELQGIAYRPESHAVYAADTTINDDGDSVFRIQRLGLDGATLDAAPLWFDDHSIGGWQGGLTYTGDIAVDPRPGQSHAYALLHPFSDGAGGKIIAINADTPTPDPANAPPAPLRSFPINTSTKAGLLNSASALAVDPSNGTVLVGDFSTPGDGGVPIVRRYAAGGADVQTGSSLALTGADIAPTATRHGARHVAVRSIAVRGDGTLAVLSDAQETELAGATVIDTPIAIEESLVDVYAPGGGHSVSFTVPKAPASVSFTPDGRLALPDPGTGGIAEYDPPAACSFAGTPTRLTATASDFFAVDRRPAPADDQVARILHFGDGGKGCVAAVHDAAITLSSASVLKGQAITITGSAVDPGGPLPDSAYTWTLDGTTHTGRTFSHTFATTGDKTITLKVDNGDTADTAERTVHVTSTPPVAAFGVAGDGATAPAALSFDASGSSDVDGPIADYAWDLDGDGSTDAHGVRVSRTYATAGSPSVRLIVTDADGDTATARKTITIVPAPAAGGDPPATVNDPPKDSGQKPGGDLGGQSVPTLKPGKATISLGGTLTPDAKGKFKVKLSCPAGTSGCTGTLTIVSAKAVASKSKKKVLTLATGTYKVAAGGATTITLTLSSKARSTLAKLKSVAIVATATGSDGSKATAKGTVKAARKGKR